MTKPIPEQIIRAACRWRGGVWSLPAPNRHHNVLTFMYEMMANQRAGLEAEQGFLTDLGRFVDRVQALRVARDAKQCEPDTRDELFSEDLW